MRIRISVIGHDKPSVHGAAPPRNFFFHGGDTINQRLRTSASGEGARRSSCNAIGHNISRALIQQRTRIKTEQRCHEGAEGEGKTRVGSHYRWFIKTSTTRGNTTLRSVFGFAVVSDKATRPSAQRHWIAGVSRARACYSSDKLIIISRYVYTLRSNWARRDGRKEKKWRKRFTLVTRGLLMDSKYDDRHDIGGRAMRKNWKSK